MRILIACEFSGVVREAFRKRGHDAWSCDLLPSLDNSPFHIQNDVIPLLKDKWDLMIAFPPCTYLTVSGIHWNYKIPNRNKETSDALDFVYQLMYNNNIPKIAIENPVGIISTRIQKPDQIIQPWQFGHPESKRTCLWLKNLPLLIPTNILTPTKFQTSGKPQWDNQTPSGQNKLGKSKIRSTIRSLTYQGIADAMANQWGENL